MDSRAEGSTRCTAQDVANWMATEVMTSDYLNQDKAVHDIAAKFGREFVYRNKAGGLSISRSVLVAFSVLKKERRIGWRRSENAWRPE
jgi:hypothetical protein